jgi:hypothetical protein
MPQGGNTVTELVLYDSGGTPRVDMFPVVGVTDLYARFPHIGAFVARLTTRPSWAASAQRPEPGETERRVEARAAA